MGKSILISNIMLEAVRKGMALVGGGSLLGEIAGKSIGYTSDTINAYGDAISTKVNNTLERLWGWF
jgi:hypothetical protein